MQGKIVYQKLLPTQTSNSVLPENFLGSSDQMGVFHALSMESIHGIIHVQLVCIFAISCNIIDSNSV